MEYITQSAVQCWDDVERADENFDKLHYFLHAFHVNSRGTHFQSQGFCMRPQHDRARLETNAPWAYSCVLAVQQAHASIIII